MDHFDSLETLKVSLLLHFEWIISSCKALTPLPRVWNIQEIIWPDLMLQKQPLDFVFDWDSTKPINK